MLKIYFFSYSWYSPSIYTNTFRNTLNMYRNINFTFLYILLNRILYTYRGYISNSLLPYLLTRIYHYNERLHQLWQGHNLGRKYNQQLQISYLHLQDLFPKEFHGYNNIYLNCILYISMYGYYRKHTDDEKTL